MAERHEIVTPVKVNYQCDDCGGYVLPTGVCLTSYPAKYPHRCSMCDKFYTFDCTYPSIRYLPSPVATAVTWAEHQAANQQALDEIAAAMGRKRE